ncbi:MAG: hypothetical protein ABFD46_02910 [Armatimonadota bacterium]
MEEQQLNADTITEETQQFNLKPKEYRIVLEGLNLLSLELENCIMKSTQDMSDRSASISNRIDDSQAAFEPRPDGTVIVKHRYSEKTKIGKKVVFSLDATFRLVFQSKNEFSDDFFIIFRAVSLNLYTWPYFRELLNNLSSRTGMPPLTLPMLKK